MWEGYEQIVSSYLEPDQIAYLHSDGITPITTTLNLHNINNYLDYIVQFSSNTLVELDVSRTKLTSNELHAIVTFQTQLHTLNISYTNVTTIVNVTSYLTQLTSLNMQGLKVMGRGLGELITLTHLNVYYTELTLAGLNEIRGLSELLVLGITLPEKFESPFSGSFTHLRELTLGRATNVTVSQLHHYPLTYINVSETDVTDAGVLLLNSLPHLRMVDLSNLAITGDGFANLTQLTHLNIAFSSTINYDSLTNLRLLQALAIEDTCYVRQNNQYVPLNDPDLGFLQHMRFLEYAELSKLTISDVGWTLLTTLPLRFLELRWVKLSLPAMETLSLIPTLVILHLQFAEYDVMWLQYLRPPALKYLSLYDNVTGITDNNIDVLTGLYLNQLNVYLAEDPDSDEVTLTDSGIGQLIRNRVVPDRSAVYSSEDHISVSAYINEYSTTRDDIFTYLKGRVWG